MALHGRGDGLVEQAARAIEQARFLLVGAGAGMGVDSGLPDFRGNEGFWRAYPPLRRLGIRFEAMANPGWFQRDPELAWGFYGHRLNLYRDTEPHGGFSIIRRWAEDRSGFVFTSNVDGHFQRAGFTDVLECHGSINHLQCADPCGPTIWSADATDVVVDPETFRAKGQLPQCPACGGMARPNILMFGDARWVWDRTEAQSAALQRWTAEAERAGGLVVIELGAGTAVPTVRHHCEAAVPGVGRGCLIRINPREPQAPHGAVSLPMGALEALTRIDALICDERR